MAGIMYDFDEPGLRHIIFRPYPNRAINAVDCAFDSPYGTIISKWASEGDGFVYEITVPANTTATVYLPAECGGGVREVEAGAFRFVSGDAAGDKKCK